MRGDRAAWVAVAVLVLTAAAFSLRENGPGGVSWLPPCLFHRLTGFHCAGCGMTRAAHAVLHGNFVEAFRFNPLGMILVPLACLGIAAEAVRWARGGKGGSLWRIGAAGWWGIGIAIFLFWILRNIPVWPFTLLAPP